MFKGLKDGSLKQNRTTLIVALAMLFSISAEASVELFSSDGSKFAVMVTANEVFYPTASGAKVFGVSVILSGREMFGVSDPVIDHGEVKMEGGRVRLYLGSFESKLSWMREGQKQDFVVRWKPQTNGLVFNRCSKTSPTLMPTDAKVKAPFPIAQSCSEGSGVQSITLSMPAEVELTESSLFETGGKGERWKEYQIPASAMAGGKIGNFVFNFQGKAYLFELVSPKQPKAEATPVPVAEKNVFENTLMPGLVNLQYSGDTVSATDSKPVVKYAIVTPALIGALRLGFSYQTALNFSATDTGIDFSESRFQMRYRFSPSFISNFYFDLGLMYNYFDIYQGSTSMRLQTYQGGPLVSLGYLFKEKNRFRVFYGMASYGSDVLTSQSTITAGYARKFSLSGTPFWIGLGYESQNYGAKTSSGAARNYSVQEFVLTLEY